MDPDAFIVNESVNGFDPHGMACARYPLRGLVTDGGAVLIGGHRVGEMSTAAGEVVIPGWTRLLDRTALANCWFAVDTSSSECAAPSRRFWLRLSSATGPASDARGQRVAEYARSGLRICAHMRRHHRRDPARSLPQSASLEEVRIEPADTSVEYRRASLGGARSLKAKYLRSPPLTHSPGVTATGSACDSNHGSSLRRSWLPSYSSNVTVAGTAPRWRSPRPTTSATSRRAPPYDSARRSHRAAGPSPP